MSFADLPAGVDVFLDANTFLYHFNPHHLFGAACKAFLEQIERGDFHGLTSPHVLSEVAHRLMVAEAISRFGWPHQGIAPRLRRHPAEVQQLRHYRQALDEITLLGIHVLSVGSQHVSRAADVSRQTGLLCSDALIIAVMQKNGLDHLASNDADFDRVPGITRYAPV